MQVVENHRPTTVGLKSDSDDGEVQNGAIRLQRGAETVVLWVDPGSEHSGL